MYFHNVGDKVDSPEPGLSRMSAFRTLHNHDYPWCSRSGLSTIMSFQDVGDENSPQPCPSMMLAIRRTIHNHDFQEVGDQDSQQKCLSIGLVIRSTLHNHIFPWYLRSKLSTTISSHDVGYHDSPQLCLSMVLAMRTLHNHVLPWCWRSGLSTTMSFHDIGDQDSP